MADTNTTQPDEPVNRIRLTKSGVQYVNPDYYLKDPAVRREIGSMGKLFVDYRKGVRRFSGVGPRGRRWVIVQAQPGGLTFRRRRKQG